MNTSLDANIPVLTEIIPPETLPMLDGETPSPLGNTANEFSEPVAGDGTLQEEQWQLMEQALRENVLKQVLSRVDFVLEHRVRDSLADVLQTAVEKLADEIRAGLKNSLEEVVTRAVTQEIAKVKASK